MLAMRADLYPNKALACANLAVNLPLNQSMSKLGVNGLFWQAQPYKDLSRCCSVAAAAVEQHSLQNLLMMSKSAAAAVE